MSSILSSNRGDNPTKLLWVDLEFTGLDPELDVITELAAIVTDFDLNVLEEYRAGVLQEEILLKDRIAANDWFATMPAQYSQDIIAESLSGKKQSVVEQDVVNLINKHWGAGDEAVVLSGNSIHADRAFVRAHLPALNSLLHYRMLDVSAFKVFMQGKYNLHFEKKETHRALDDIKESIAELQFYQDKWSI